MKLQMYMYRGNIKLEEINLSNRSYDPEYFAAMGQKKIKGIHITRSLFSPKISTDLKFLDGIKDKSALKVLLIDVDIVDSSAIERLYMFDNLLELSIINSSSRSIILNLERFPHLKNLIVRGNITQVGQDKIKLKTLKRTEAKKLDVDLWGNTIEELHLYGIKQLNFEELKNLINLKKLVLTKVQVSDLKDIGVLKNLEEIEINYCSKLINIHQLEECKELRKVYFESTKNIAEFTPLTSLKKLKDLTLFKCGEITSLKFIDSIPSLERLLFTETNIVDGDLKPCLRLKTAWSSLGKRHYNINVEHLPGR